ncbi:hypothetical protein ABT071_10655 [Streptomyces sp. NPDC002506]|uniref:hypothetical protein n=1 Tax=Streptomyces sp. NPDC002506 TaxID=3154536 RepID=UPI0033168261
MAFGRNKAVEPFEPMHWSEMTQFTVGRAMRYTFRKSKRGTGPHAIRFPRARGGDQYLVPGLYIVPAAGDASLSKAGFRLFEDEGGRHLLCSALPDGSDRYRVRDPHGQELGSVRRTPLNRRLTHQGLWLEPVGHPAVVARHNWARDGVRAAMGRGVGHAAESLLDSLVSFGDDGGSDSGAAPKPAVWAVETDGSEGQLGEAVLTLPRTGQFPRWYFVERDSRLDKRLAFALVVLRESEAFGADRR